MATENGTKRFDEANPEDLISTSVGYLSPDRYSDIPPQHHAKHEFLIYLFNLIQSLVIETQQQVPRELSLKPDEIPDFDGEEFSRDPIGYAAKKCPQAKQPILLDVSLALMSDFYCFLHHALTAFEKRQFTVGYANLRKPLRENLPLLCWICADEDEFFKKFLTDPVKAFNSGALSPEKRTIIFEKASEKGVPFSKFPKDVVENIVYSRTFTHGLGPSLDKATHLVTSKKDMQTEEFNFNFIFKSPLDNDVYEVGYVSLSLILMYAYLVIYSVCGKFYKALNTYQTWMLLAVWGAYEAIFLGKKSEGFSLFESEMKDTLKCMHCGASFELNKNNIPRLVMIERIECYKCERDQQFPLYWLFCHEANEPDQTEKE